MDCLSLNEIQLNTWTNAQNGASKSNSDESHSGNIFTIPKENMGEKIRK
jgi:hypothetical protein